MPIAVYIALCYLILNITLVVVFNFTPLLIRRNADFFEPFGEFVMTADVIGAMWVIFHFLEKRTMRQSGFDMTKARLDMAVGFVLGFFLVGLMVIVDSLCGVYRPISFNPSCNVIKPLIVFFFVGLAEEVIFRATIFQLLERRIGTWSAFAASCVIFGLAHMFNDVSGSSWIMKLIPCVLLIIEAGVVLNAAYLVRRTLWLGVGMHWAWNFFEGPFFGLPVSGNTVDSTLITANMHGPILLTGGKFGPEGSLAGVVLGTVFGVVTLMYAVRHGKAIQKKPETK